MRSRLALVLVVAIIVTAACNVSVGGTQIAGRPPSYQIQALFPTTVGLYPGSFVRQLGINVGVVSKVANQGDHVLVTMKIDNKYHLAADAKAILVGDSVLGERYVQFEPAYVGGGAMAPGARIGLDRVTVPVETDAVLRSLNSVLRQINPTGVRDFTVSLAALLQGEGAKLNDLIGHAAGTVQLLADKGNDLGRLNGTLAKLTGQLSTKDQALARLVQAYDLLSQTIAADRGQLDGTITQLTNLTTQGAGLLDANLAPIQHDVAALTSAGQTIDRNLPAVDVGLKYSPRLFTAAKNAYDPMHNWLPLNSQSNPAETSAVLGASIRDALASLCRRLAARQPALGSALAACGDPASGFFDPVIGLLPSLIKNLPGQVGPAAGPVTQPHAQATRPESAIAAFAAGLALIPGLSDQQRSALAGADAGTRADAGSASGEGASNPSAGPPTGPPSGPSAGPPGAAAVAALSAVPLQPMLAPPVHHRGLVGRVLHWVESLW